MKVVVKGKQLDVGDALRTHIEERLPPAIEKYFVNAIESTVVLTKDRHLFKADISVHAASNIQMEAAAEADDPYAAADLAIDKAAKRLRRYKRRLVDHHTKAARDEAIAAAAYVLQAEPEDVPDDHEEPAQPVVVAEMTTRIESLTVSQAVMRLDLANLPALMFRNSAHGGLNMIYRRSDGNVGWVDPADIEKSTSTAA